MGDKGSGKEQSISITGASTLSDNEVDKMVKDAEMNASADKEKRERIDIKNQAEKQIGELGDKVDEAAKNKVEEKRVQLKEATEKDDYESMKSLVEELQQELYSLGASVYQQANAASQAADDSNSDNKNDGDDVID